MPLLSRNFYDLTTLVPGVAAVGGSINSYALSVSGQREFANSIQLDGVESTTNRTQDVTVAPSVDSVQEFKVITSSYDAEYGSAAGGIVQIQTKAGSNQFHGTAYEFWRPDFLTARPYAFGGSTQPAPALTRHNFGGTLGGPVRKNRSFFFASYEGSRQNNAYTYLDSTIPFWPATSATTSRALRQDPLSHDLEPNRAYAEVSRTAHELQKIGSQIVGLKIKNDIAILWSRDSDNAISFMPFTSSGPQWTFAGSTADYGSLVQQIHKSLYDLRCKTL